MTASSKLSACLLNISEARNKCLVEKIAKAAIIDIFNEKEQDEYVKMYSEERKFRPDNEVSDLDNKAECVKFENLKSKLFGKNYKRQTSILNIFSDTIYNRSVVTVAGTLPGVENGVTAACIEAFRSLEGELS